MADAHKQAAMQRALRDRAHGHGGNDAPPRDLVRQFHALKHDFPGLRGRMTTARSETQVPDEHYVPQAWADQKHGKLVWNTTQHQGDPIYRHWSIGHELGHLYEPGHMTPKLGHEYARRTQTAEGRYTDPWGLSNSGPGTTHSHANELYASDVQMAMATQGNPLPSYNDDGGFTKQSAEGYTIRNGTPQQHLHQMNPQQLTNLYSWMRRRALAPHSVGTGTLQYPGSFRI